MGADGVEDHCANSCCRLMATLIQQDAQRAIAEFLAATILRLVDTVAIREKD
jgi:hypothetical protein